MEINNGTTPGDPHAAAGGEGRSRGDRLGPEADAAMPSGWESAASSASGQSLEARLEAQQQRLDEIERSLVERIADVDDDRRRTAVLLQRARQGQEEEVAERLQRQASLFLWAIVGLSILVIGAGGLLYWQADSRYQTLAEEIAALEQTQAEQLVRTTLDDQVPQRIAALGATVAEISSSLTRIDERASSEIAPLAENLERLTEEQQELATRLGEIRRGLTERLYEVEEIAEAALRAQSAPAPQRGRAAPDRAAAATEEAASEVPPRSEPDAEDRASGAEAITPAPGPGTPASRETAPASERPQAGGERIRVDERPFGIQLIGYFRQDSIPAFIEEREGLPERVYYRETRYQGRPWYVVIHSLHPTYEAAEEARLQLPPELLTLEPFVRRLPAGAELGVIEQ